MGLQEDIEKLSKDIEKSEKKFKNLTAENADACLTRMDALEAQRTALLGRLGEEPDEKTRAQHKATLDGLETRISSLEQSALGLLYPAPPATPTPTSYTLTSEQQGALQWCDKNHAALAENIYGAARIFKQQQEHFIKEDLTSDQMKIELQNIDTWKSEITKAHHSISGVLATFENVRDQNGQSKKLDTLTKEELTASDPSFSRAFKYVHEGDTALEELRDHSKAVLDLLTQYQHFYQDRLTNVTMHADAPLSEAQLEQKINLNEDAGDTAAAHAQLPTQIDAFPSPIPSPPQVHNGMAARIRTIDVPGTHEKVTITINEVKENLSCALPEKAVESDKVAAAKKMVEEWKDSKFGGNKKAYLSGSDPEIIKQVALELHREKVSYEITNKAWQQDVQKFIQSQEQNQASNISMSRR